MALSGKWKDYAWSVAATGACTVAGLAMAPRFDPVNIAMVYLLAVVVISVRCSRGAAVVTAILCVAAFDFVFVPPSGTFTVDDWQYLFTFAVMLAVALIISRLTETVKREAMERARLATQAESERIRAALLASISHDLRTPLAVMAGASSGLAERGENMSPQERSRLARSVFEQSQAMSDHVAKVLEMTRLETGRIELRRDWESLAEIAGAVLQRLAEPLAAHRVLVELGEDLPLVRVDSALIEQVLRNLLENAARHTPAGTVVRIRAWASENEIVVSVEDNGPGLADSDLERVFGKFERATAEAAGGGMGLGLAICRAIVTLHGGRAWAEGLPLGGMAFRFSLPREEVPQVPREPAAP